ncbi:hypothetical protein NL676_034652 [Syzygium grande]|nr:hypothetical protein NL676_034652 [Syzygium grande]
MIDVTAATQRVGVVMAALENPDHGPVRVSSEVRRVSRAVRRDGPVHAKAGRTGRQTHRRGVEPPLCGLQGRYQTRLEQLGASSPPLGRGRLGHAQGNAKDRGGS